MKNKFCPEKAYELINGIEIYTDAKNGFKETIEFSIGKKPNSKLLPVKICKGIIRNGNLNSKAPMHISSAPDVLSSFALTINKDGSPMEIELVEVINGIPHVIVKQNGMII